MKVWNYVFLAITMIIFFQFAGFSTGFSSIFSFANIGFAEDNSLNQTDISFSNFYDYIFDAKDTDEDGDGFGWLALLVGTGLAIGLFAAGKPDIAIKAGFASAIFVVFVSTLYYPVTHALETGVAAWATGILAVIFIPLSIGFLFALVEYIVGGTTD